MGFGLRDREGWLQVPGEVERGWWPSLMKTMQRHNTIPFKLPKAKTSDNTQWKPVTHKHTTYYMLLLQVEHDTVKPLWENKHQISSFPFSPCGSPLLSFMKAGTFFFFLTDSSTLFLEKNWTQGTVQPSPQILNTPDSVDYLLAAVRNVKLFLEYGGGRNSEAYSRQFFPQLSCDF